MNNIYDTSNLPTSIELKTQVGHGELGLIVGKWKRSCLVLYVDRATKFLRLMRPQLLNVPSITEAIKTGLTPIAPNIISITAVERKEFSQYEEFSKHLNCNFYYSKQFSTPQLGLCSNTITLINQYFPKNTDFLLKTYQEIKEVENKLNTRPRKALNYQTPDEAFSFACGLISKDPCKIK